MTMYSSAAQYLQGFHSSLANMFTQQAKQGQLVGCEWDITVMKHLTKMILNTSHSYLDWKSDEWTRDNQISSDLLSQTEKWLDSVLVITETAIIQIIFQPAITDGRDEGLVIFLAGPQPEEKQKLSRNIFK